MRKDYSKLVMDNTLDYFRKANIPAVVCGGFVRDTLLAEINLAPLNSFNDIDIYIHKKHYTNLEDISEKLKIGTLHIMDVIDKDHYTSAENDIVEVLTTRCPKSHYLIQIIVIDSDMPITQYIQEKFDMSINMVAYDGLNFFRSPAFLKTLETMVIKVNPNVDVEKLIIKGRIKKLGLRFDNFTIEGLGNPDFCYKDKYIFIARNKLNDMMYEPELKEGKYFFKNDKVLVL